MMDEDITFGGFIKSNIQKWIIEDCISSGDPTNMFCAIREAMDDLEEELGYWADDYDKWLSISRKFGLED